jgi:hypothetical protein
MKLQWTQWRRCRLATLHSTVRVTARHLNDRDGCDVTPHVTRACLWPTTWVQARPCHAHP